MDVKRRHLVAGSFALGALATRPGWSTTPDKPADTLPSHPAGPRPQLVPIRAQIDQLTDIKVCLRPFRAMGPRLDVEKIGDKTVIHNYGHGGSGWSLSWGSAEIVVGKAASTLANSVAVIGCGVIGLTSALTAQRAGMNVTIYTKALLPHTRSVRANGSWTPDSRIALTKPAGDSFPALWEQMARYSWKTYRDYLGLPGNPIDFRDHYILSDHPFGEHTAPPPDPAAGDYASTGKPQNTAEFADYGDLIRDIIPQSVLLTDAENPFPVPHAKRRATMMFNFGAYGHLLLSEFYQAGGKIVIKEFHAPADLKTLKEDVIINCPGYAAHDWWQDKTLIPVRGQTNWLPPQHNALYGVNYRGASLLSKTDGVMVQALDFTGIGEMVGVGNSFEHADRAEAAKAIGIFEELFARMGG